MFEWLVSFVVSAVISWALSPDPEDVEEQQDGVLLNKQSNIAQIPVIYGNRKVGGTRVFVETSGADNEYLYIALVLCEGEIQSIGNVWINDVLSTDSKFSGLVTINKHLGTDSQTADTTLTSAPSWTTSHRLRGVAYLGIRLKWDREVFGSIPTIQADVLGKKVYDPRNSSTAYSQNPALCLLDYMTNSRYGKGLSSSVFESDYASWKTSADICDINVTPYSGGSTIDTFSCNVVINTDKTLMENIKVFMSGMRGIVPYTQGVYKLIIEASGTATFAFTENHIIEGISFEGEKRSNRYNRVIATFTNPDKNWQEDTVEYPDAGSSEYTTMLSEDGGFELESRVALPTITNVYQAKYMAQSILKKSRDGIRCSFLSTAEALQVAIGDIVSVTHSTPAWNAKPFRVMELSLKDDGNVIVVLSEHQNTFYAWSSTTEVPSYPDTNLPNPYSASAPTGLSISSGENYQVTNNDGSTSPRIYVTWTASNDSFVDYYVIQARVAGGTPTENAWDIEHTTDSSPLYISGVASGTTIDVRIKAVNAMGVSSSWVQVDNHAIASLVGGGAGGVTTFSQTSAPTADLEVGDLWFDTDDSNKMYRYEGSPTPAWIAKTGTMAGIDVPTTLSTITPSAGTLTSGTLQVGSGGINIIGGTVGGSRLEIDNETLSVYDGSTLRLKIGKLS
jgi:hypothetical protein